MAVRGVPGGNANRPASGARTLLEMPLYVPLLAALPALTMWTGNARQVPVSSGLPVVLLSGLFGLVALAGFSLLLRSLRRGALPAAAASLAFFTFGRLGSSPITLAIGMLVVGGALLAIGIIARRLPTTALRTWTFRANAFLSLVVVANVVAIGSSLPSGAPRVQVPGLELDGAVASGRDVIYIVPDRYPSETVLEDFYEFDNGGFTDALRTWGFSVDAGARSNYGKTSHSLASTLNFEGVEELLAGRSPRADDLGQLDALVRDHQLGRVMRGLGYEYVHIGSWWEPTATSTSATTTLNRSQLGLHLGATTEFSLVFETSTALPSLSKVLRRLGLDGGVLSDDEFHRAYGDYGLSQLERMAASPRGGRFIFAHILLPHPPFVFGADGEPSAPVEITDPEAPRAFIDQLHYLNDRLLPIVEAFLSVPEPDRPIMVIQADEGPTNAATLRDGFDWTNAPDSLLREKFGILKAIYIPSASGGTVQFPNDLTPVNTWRRILDEIAGIEFERRPDRSYVYPNDHDFYSLVDVTDRLSKSRPDSG